MKPTYYIDGDNNATYGTLDDIRRHVWMQSENDRKAYDGMYIVRANKNDEPKAVRMIRVKGRNVVLLSKIKSIL